MYGSAFLCLLRNKLLFLILKGLNLLPPDTHHFNLKHTKVLWKVNIRYYNQLSVTFADSEQQFYM